MKLDTHVHSYHSGHSSIYPLQRILRESYNTPQGVYRVSKARGMDLVTLTDHDDISGALSIAHLPDVIVGCEVTGVFPDDGVSVHLNVFGLDETQHREIQRLRRDVRDLLRYLRQQKLFTSLNHVASGINGPITAPHVAVLLPWLQGIEVNNGSRLPSTEPHGAVPRRGVTEDPSCRQRLAHASGHRVDLDRGSRRTDTR